MSWVCHNEQKAMITQVSWLSTPGLLPDPPPEGRNRMGKSKQEPQSEALTMAPARG